MGFMVRIVAVLFFVLIGARGFAQGEPGSLLLPPSEIARLQGVIAAQVAAFQDNDFETAFSFASPGIQQIFGTPERFAAMVALGYGPIFKTLDYEFADLIGNARTPVQVVVFTGADLRSILAFYRMVLLPGLGWRIDGVQVRPLARQAG